MGDEVTLLQSRSGMIHVEGCPGFDHGAGTSGGVRVRASEIEMIGPYSRCARCAPPIPTHATARVRTARTASALTHADVGRDTELGLIEEIRHRVGAIEIDFAHGFTWVFAPTEHISFVGEPEAG